MASARQLRQEAESEAARVLSDFGATEMYDMPVDATAIAEFCGADVFVDDLDDEDLDGFVLIGRRDAEITINTNRIPVRRRFTCAHELGHVIHQWKVNTGKRVRFVDNEATLRLEDRDVKRRDGVSQAGTHAEEIWANAFAAALLMPEKLVKSLHAGGQAASQMAKFFRVSPQAMTLRLPNLGLS